VGRWPAKLRLWAVPVAAAAALPWVLPATSSEAAPTKPAAKPVPATPAARPQDVLADIRVIEAKASRFAGKEPSQPRFDSRIPRELQVKLRIFNFQFYRQVKHEKITLPFGVETRVPMPFRMGVRITHEGIENGKIRLKVQIGRKQALKVLLDAAGTSNLVQGITLKNNQTFILAVLARTK
jgi:hypothetical protein